MKGFIRLSIFTASICAPAHLHAAEWWYVTSDSEGSAYFVDAASLVRVGDMVQVWTYNIFKTPERGVKSAKNRSKRWCSTRKYQVGTEIQYGDDDSIVRSLPPLASDPIREIAPDTVAEGINDLVCSPVSAWTSRGAVKLKPNITPRMLTEMVHNAAEQPPE